MLPPQWLCRLHLWQEHKDLHKFRGRFLNRFNLHNYRVSCWYGLVEPLAMQSRHDELVEEIVRRGYKHLSPYEMPSLKRLSQADRAGTVDRKKAEKELRALCPDCADRIRRYKFQATIARKRAERCGSEQHKASA